MRPKGLRTVQNSPCKCNAQQNKPGSLLCTTRLGCSANLGCSHGVWPQAAWGSLDCALAEQAIYYLKLHMVVYCFSAISPASDRPRGDAEHMGPGAAQGSQAFARGLRALRPMSRAQWQSSWSRPRNLPHLVESHAPGAAHRCCGNSPASPAGMHW